MIVTISDAGAPDSGKYGNNIDLSAGVGIYVRKYDSSGLVTDYTAGIPIKTNADWGRYCHDVKPIEWGLGDDYVSVRWTFSKAGNPIYLDGDSSEELRVELNDDLSALVEHYFHVQGELHDAS